MTGSGDFVEVQGTAEGAAFSKTMLAELTDLAAAGVERLVEVQRKAVS